jgi:hypothetical protein
MWGENCINEQCDQHYNSENRLLGKTLSKAIENDAEAGER